MIVGGAVCGRRRPFIGGCLARGFGGAPLIVRRFGLRLRLLRRRGLLLIVVGARALILLLGVDLALLAPHLILRPLVFECPGLRALLLAIVVERAAVSRVHAIENDVDVAMLGVVVADIDGLVLIPAHVLQQRIGCFHHVLGRRLIILVPGERQGLGRIFADAAAALHPGLHLQVGLILGRAPHLLERAAGIDAETVARVAEPDALIGLGLQMLVPAPRRRTCRADSICPPLGTSRHWPGCARS